MKKDKKRKLPFQIDRFPAHTFHYYSPPNVNSKDLYDLNESSASSKPSPFSFLKSNNPTPPPSPLSSSPPVTSSILSSSASLNSDQSQFLLNNFEKTINSIDKGGYKKQRMDCDKINKIFQDLSNNRKDMNNSLSNFQRLNNNLFDNSKINFNTNNSMDNDNSNNNNNQFYNSSSSSSGYKDDINMEIDFEMGSEDGLFSFLYEEDDNLNNLNNFNNSGSNASTLDYDLSFISTTTNTSTAVSPSSTTTNTSTAVSPSSTTTNTSTAVSISTTKNTSASVSPTISIASDNLNSPINPSISNNSIHSSNSNSISYNFLYDGDLFDKVLDQQQQVEKENQEQHQ